MFKPVEVKALPNYRLWIAYDNGVSGEIDLAYLAGKGVFSIWRDPAVFAQVYIGDNRQIAWSEEIELCADSLYLKLTGQTPAQLFADLKTETAYA